MHRRELFRLLSATAMIPIVPPELLRFLRQAQPTPEYTLRTLNPHENETIVAMTDGIVPATDTPGAKVARVNEFIDGILTDWATPEERKSFLAGIASVDIRSQTLFSKNFVEATPPQQFALLQSMDDGIDWADDRFAREAAFNAYDRQLQGEFFRVFKMITLYGYYTSEIGFTKELKLEIIPGAQHGCVPVVLEKKA